MRAPSAAQLILSQRVSAVPTPGIEDTHVELSADLLKSMLSGIKTEQGKGYAEMRRNPRVAVRYTVKIIPYINGALGQPLRVWTRDISSGGIGLIHSSPMDVGTRFIIQLPRESGKSLLLLCTVRNCTMVSDELFGIGSSFAEIAGATPSVAESEANRRAVAASAVRQPAAAPLPLAADAATSSPMLTEEVERISRAILS